MTKRGKNSNCTQKAINVDEIPIKRDFTAALAFAKKGNLPEFAARINLRARDLRAYKAGREIPSTSIQDTVIAAAENSGWQRRKVRPTVPAQ